MTKDDKYYFGTAIVRPDSDKNKNLNFIVNRRTFHQCPNFEPPSYLTRKRKISKFGIINGSKDVKKIKRILSECVFRPSRLWIKKMKIAYDSKDQLKSLLLNEIDDLNRDKNIIQERDTKCLYFHLFNSHIGKSIIKRAQRLSKIIFLLIRLKRAVENNQSIAKWKKGISATERYLLRLLGFRHYNYFKQQLHLLYIQIQKWLKLSNVVSRPTFLDQLNKHGLSGLLIHINNSTCSGFELSLQDLEHTLIEQKISFRSIKFEPRPKRQISRFTKKLFCHLLISFIFDKDKYHIVWVDESSICPSNFKKKHWTRLGEIKSKYEPIAYQKLILLGAISNVGCLGLMGITTGHCSKVFTEFLFDVLTKITLVENYKRQVVIVLDNASIHKNKEMLEMLTRNNIIVLFNLPHHP